MARAITDEIEDKVTLVSINRVTKVVKGGRRFGFSAVVIYSNKKGYIGYGLGKAKEVMAAKEKATQAAKKNLYRVYLKEGRTLHHDVIGNFGSTKVILRSAKPGTGIIAGGAMRAIFNTLGINDVVAKLFGSSNVHNVVKATFAAFDNHSSPIMIAKKRGKNIGEILSKRKLNNTINEIKING